MVFNIWNEHNVCLSWDETEEWAALLGLVTVPVLYRGPWDKQRIRMLFDPYERQDKTEGIVRVSRRFAFDEFSRVVAKVVRENHARTDQHWMHRSVITNRLAPNHKDLVLRSDLSR